MAVDLELVAAVSKNGVIGRGGALPWRLPEDLRRFKALTLGHPVLMGRRTYESIAEALGGPLPGRRNVVLTRQAGYAAPGCEVAADLASALALVDDGGGGGTAFVIGGAAVYAEALPLCRRLHLTRVDADVEGDVRFPAFDAADFEERLEGAFTGPPGSPYPCRFVTLERRAGAPHG